MNKEKKEALKSVIKGIKKKFGDDSIMLASDAGDKLKVRKFKTPSTDVNNMLYGGFCGIVEIYGRQKSGKTSLCIETIAYNQKLDKDFVAAWLETEGSVTEEILVQHGVDLNRLVFIPQEEIGSAESALDILRSLISSGSVDFAVVNSVAGLSPKKEIEDDLEKQNVALTARIMSKLMRIITGAVMKNKMCLVFINQLRTNVGVMYGNPNVTTGGNALAYYAHQRVNTSEVKLEKSDPITEDVGMRFHLKAIKNRFSYNNKPNTECYYYIRYATGIDNILSLPNIIKGMAGTNGIRVSGSWIYYEDPNGNPFTIDGIECKFQSATKLITAMESSAELLRVMQQIAEGAEPEFMDENEVQEIKQQESLNEQALEGSGAFEDEIDENETE